MTLSPIVDHATFRATRGALHAVAEHVLAAYRYHAERRIGLVATHDGFGTPDLGPAGSVRVDGTELVVQRRGSDVREPITSLRTAAAACGIEPQAPDVYPTVTTLDVDAPLAIDADAADRLVAWLSYGWDLLRALEGATEPVLWPEHFDAAVELGDEAAGSRGTFGVSPGDDAHDAPYLYVTHWADVPASEYWNDASFAGASLPYDEVADTSDPVGLGLDFFARGRAALERR